MSKIKAVLFDWDLTLGAVLGGVSNEERLSILFHNIGLHYDSENITEAIAQRQRDIERGSLQGEVRPQTREQYILFYQQLLTILGHPDPPRQLAERLYEGYADLPFILYKDTVPTLQALAAQRILLGIITNHSSAIRSVIKELLGEFIPPEHVIISDELGVYKPDRMIFVQAAAHLKTPTRQCVYVGDDLAVDAIATVTSGDYARALWLDRSGCSKGEKLPRNVYRITTLIETLEYLLG
jgi:FMN phosphatase YigB (HAD superfamily)